MAKILVVDDAATVRMFLRSLLSSAEHEVIEAHDGIEGLEKALSEPPDLAFVDINMPALDGYGMIRKLRADPSTCSLPIIMCSTESKPVDELHAYQAGANFYLRKPVDPTLVLALADIFGDPR
ncbi:MAG: response regulator [Myxococcota bacterium]